MDSSTILEKFLDARANVDEVLAPSQLRKWFPKSVNSTSLQIIYEILHADRQRVMRSVKENIKREFNIPVDSMRGGLHGEDEEEKEEPEQESGDRDDHYTIPSLLSQLADIEKAAEIQDISLDRQIDEYSNEIRVLSDIIEEITLRDELQNPTETAESIAAIQSLVDLIGTRAAV